MSDVNRIPTHIEGLDENMQGGIPKKHICIVAGASGAMKSSLTFSLLYNSVLYGDTSGIYVTLEQGKESLKSHMSNMGMNVEDARVRNRIAIIDLADLRVQLDEQGMSDRVDWLGQLIKQLTSYRNSIGSRSTEDEVFDFHRTDGEEYTDFLQGTEYVLADAGDKKYSNDTDDKYQQFRFDFRRLTYFIDSDGYLVARLNKDYDHNANGPK